MTHPTFFFALRYWLKLGCTSFGGPAGQIAMMHAELVERRHWISERRFLHALNYCMVLPGPEATQLAIYIGWLLHKTRGGIAAGLLFILPSLLLLILLSWIYLVFGKLPMVAAVFYGIKPAVIALVLLACHRIATRTLKNPWLWAIALAALAGIALFNLPFPVIMLGAALCGIAGSRLTPDSFHGSAAHHAASAAYGPALIDDDTPPPPHARFSWTRLGATIALGLLPGALAWGALATVLGLSAPATAMALFFSKAALLSFGGAYAVLPYVMQGAVEQAHWLSAVQMMDGLALGETTPGPLIMIVSYVGFLGGWQTAAAHPLLPAILGALVATFFTFLPSFVFVLAGGPLVEATRGESRLAAPLTAISAAVTGVIASLALLFARQVFHLDAGWANLADWDYLSMMICCVATAGMLRFRWGTIPVLFGCAAAGLVVSYLY